MSQGCVGRMLRARHHEIFNRFECWKGFVEPGFLVNFLGVKTREYFLGKKFREDMLRGKHLFTSQCLGSRFVATELPGFNDWYFEWIEVLEAVTLAQDRFTMIELGAGYGRWLANAALALRHINGPPYKLIGVEAEPSHFRWMKEHMQDNAIEASNCELIEAAVADKDGWVEFYVGNPSDWYGQRIWQQNDPYPEGSISLRKVKAVSLNTLLSPLDNVDLIHIDVQGSELSVLGPAADQLNKKVRRIYVATHGLEIESGLRRLFQGLGWKTQFDYPSMSESPTPWGTIKLEDGVQSWIGPR